MVTKEVLSNPVDEKNEKLKEELKNAIQNYNKTKNVKIFFDKLINESNGNKEEENNILKYEISKINEEEENMKKDIEAARITINFLIHSHNESNVFENIHDYKFIIKNLLTIPVFKGKSIKLEKIFQSSHHGFSISEFRRICNNIPYNIILVKTSENERFGGFTQLAWEGNDVSEKKDDFAFCFSLTKKKIYNIIKGKTAIGDYKNYGPYFLFNIFYIGEGRDLKSGHCGGLKGSHYSGENTQYEINNGKETFTVEEFEFYQVVFE